MKKLGAVDITIELCNGILLNSEIGDLRYYGHWVVYLMAISIFMI